MINVFPEELIRNDLKVRVSGVLPESVVDGPGLRGVVFFQGCRHACPGCHNPETWDVQGGEEYGLDDIYRQLKLNPLIQGVTFSGGEPFLQAGTAAHFGRFLKSLHLNLWVYTGYIWEYLIPHAAESGFAQLLEVTDVLVDGPYQETARDLDLPYRGSANQRLINVPESLRNGRVICWEPVW